MDELKVDNMTPEKLIYKTIGDKTLSVDVYPPTDQSAVARPAIIMIHGGGWSGGNPSLLAPHCRYFASRGIVAVNIEYRLVNKDNKLRISDCIADCRDAYQFILKSADKLKIDTGRIVIAGESAGGHLAAMVGMMTGNEKLPAAMVLYNPVVDPAATKWMSGHTGVAALPESPAGETWQQRAERVSPIKLIRAGLPPVLLIHGVKDSTVPVEQADKFAELMRAEKNKVEYQRMEGWSHAFLIPGYGKEEQNVAALQMTDKFLSGLGYIAGEPTVKVLWRPGAFYPLFSDEQRKTVRYIQAESRIFEGYPYLDGQWQGIITDSAGDTWFGVSSHDGVHAAQLFRYQPKKDKLERIADLAEVCGETDTNVGDGVPEGKIHSEMFEDGNIIYCATTDAHALHKKVYSGGYWLAINRKTGVVSNLGKSITNDGLLCAGYDKRRKLMYGHTNVQGVFTVFDVKKRAEKIIGIPQQDYIDAWKADTDPKKPSAIWPRGITLMVAGDGKVYGAKSPGCAFWCYDPATGKIYNIDVNVQIPDEVKAGDTTAVQRWRQTSIHLSRWDARDRCFYLIRSYDEMLCRFYPPVNGKPGRLENIVKMGLPDGAHRFGQRYPSCTLVINGRTVWYTPYTGWGGITSLVSYNIDSKILTNYGQIITDDNRQIAECHSMTAGKDGKLYMVAFVYSIDGKDPIQENAMRDKYPFHPRLLIIDMKKIRQP
jgi:acetyl esterase/lipase